MSRARYRWNPDTQALESLSAEWSDAERRAPTTTEALVYGDAGRAQDGTPLDSRTKHREYLHRNGLAMADDYRDTWAKAKAEREAFYQGRGNAQDTRELRDTVGKALYQQKRGRK
jgi:hypothetical protein